MLYGFLVQKVDLLNCMRVDWIKSASVENAVE